VGAPVTLLEFKSHLEELAGSMTELNQELAAQSLELIELGFKHQADPYAKGWHRRKRAPKDGHPIHDYDARLRDSFRAETVSDQGFEIVSIVPYAGVRQYGVEGKKWPWPRPMTPLRSDGLGTWGVPFQKTVLAFIQRKLR
jgi:phage gpG-like protein